MSIFRRSVRAAVPAVVIALAVFVGFRNKAFTVDDLTFLTMADHMLEDPLHPASVQLSVNGRPPEWISAGMWSGPVMPALLVPSVAAGGAEWLAHLAMLLVFLIGIYATAALAIRLGASDASARWAALLVTTSPAVIALSTTSMPDVPTMSFSVLGVERLLAYRTERGLWRAAVAAIALALSVLSRQHAALVLPCVLPMMWSAWPRSIRELVAGFDWSIVATLIGAVVLVVAVYVVMSDAPPGGGLTSAPVSVADLSRWQVNLANIPAQWVLTFPLGLVWVSLHGRRMATSWWCWAAALVGVFLAWETQSVYQQYDWLWWQAPITALGTAVFADLVVDAWRRRDLVDLGLAAWLLIALPIVVYSHLPPKYLVPTAPAMAVLIVRSVGRMSSPCRKRLGMVCVLGLSLGLLIIHADATQAWMGKRGGELVARQVARGKRVWFDGTWGFQWYATKAGARPLTGADYPAAGDIIVIGIEGWISVPWPNKVLLRRVTHTKPGGRIMEKPAGFYSNVAWGPLPWMWSDQPLQPIEVFQL
jgi:4-amino-4-deoxy-L-arabinose transferase-like glycosyltransferase